MPEVRSVVLRDDLPVPGSFVGTVRPGANLLVAVLLEPADDEPVGLAVVAGDVPVLTLDHLWVRPDVRRQGLGRMIEELVRARASSVGADVLAVDVPQANPAMRALAAGTRVLGEHMTRSTEFDAPWPADFGWRSLTAQEYGGWYERQVRAYAEDNLARAAGDWARALERSRADFVRLLPAGLETPDTQILVLTARGEPVGHLWLAHHRTGETFGFDLEIVPERRREGWARAAVALAGRLASEVGDDVLGLHVFGASTGARKLYESEGFVVQSTSHDLLARA